MTTIHMNWADLTLKAEGHAGQAEKGQDIVCAGISALTQALALRLVEDEKRGRLKLDLTIDSESGSLRARAEPRSGREEQTRAYYKVIMAGLKAIERQYPEYVKIGEVNVHGNL